MRTDTLSIPFWSPEEIEAALRPALAQIEARRVLAYPTETVYGFGGGIDRDSVDALVALKQPAAGKAVSAAHRRPGHDRATRPRSAELRGQPRRATLAGAVHARAARRRAPRPDRLRGPEGGVAVRWTSHPADRPADSRAWRRASRRRAPTGRGFRRPRRAAEILSQWGDAVARGRLRVLDGGTLDAVAAVDGRRLHRAASARHSAGRDSAASTLRESVPNLIGDA